MICESQETTRLHPEALSARAEQALVAMQRCSLCAWDCQVDRRSGPAGKCHAGPVARWFIAQLEVADEAELIPSFNIALSGCNLRCAFCITGEESWNAKAGHDAGLGDLAMRAWNAVDRGARSVIIYGGEPTVHAATLIEMAAVLPRTVPLVLKTNGLLSHEGRELLQGVFDLWLVDYKFGNDACATRVSHAENYIEVLTDNLVWARDHSELMIRHLLLPGHLDCCWKPIARWISENLPDVKVSLKTGFWPAWKSARCPELLEESQGEEAAHFAKSLNLRMAP